MNFSLSRRFFLPAAALLFFGNVSPATAQTPADDPHWMLVAEDNFNVINYDMWKIKNNWDNTSADAYGNFDAKSAEVHVFRADNVWTSGGNLVLRTKREKYTCSPIYANAYGCNRQFRTGKPYDYTAGMIESKIPYNFLYGYIEARVKIPHAYGLWPSFWTFRGDGVPNTYNASEIDIYEMNGFKDNNIVGTNLHMSYCEKDATSIPCPTDEGQHTCPGVPCLGKDLILDASYDNRWMVWAVEWTPYQITWYLDGNPVRSVPNPGIVAPVKTYMGIGVTQWALPTDTNSVFDHRMYVDYIRFYKLRAECNSSINVCNYNLDTHPHRAVKTIAVGGSGCSATLSAGKNVVFRATDYIDLKEGFSIPLGASFLGLATPCY